MEISILIVDDDKILVDKLEETVNWKKVGITMVFTAYNIRQAQKILKEFSIQMMLCDIDMPQGSGLELLEWMRNRGMDTECIFLSSYANFAYAQKALSLSSREYLLKPISNQELEQVLFKMTEEAARKKNVKAIQESGEGKVSFWKKILLGESDEYDSEQRKILEKAYKSDDAFYLQIVRVFVREKESERQKRYSLCKFILYNRNSEAVIPVADNEWIMVMKRDECENIKEKSHELAVYINKNIHETVSIYVSSPCSAMELHHAWKKLKRVREDELPRKNGVLMDGDLVYGSDIGNPPWDIWQKMMATYQGMQSVMGAIHEYLQQIYHNGHLNVKKLRQFLRELNQFLYTYLAEQKLRFDQVFDASEFDEREAEAYVFYEGCIDFIEYLFQMLLGNLSYDQDNAMERVKEYISKNLDKDLSRGVLAREVFLSEDYLSKIFKNKTGVSLANYIALKRVEKAKEYLEYSDLAVSKIALEVGYHNFSYFSKTFRDLAGITPNEYRNNKKKN